MTMFPHPDLDRHVHRYYGKYGGEVVGNEDPDQMGRIEVVVPAVLGAELRVWARPCLPYAHFFVPEVGSRVWVEFEAGDPQHPLWVGVWYPRGTVPEEARRTPPQNRVIQTASGHTIELHDEEGNEKIVIRHKLDSFVSIDANGSVLISNQRGSHVFLDSEEKKATVMDQNGNLLAMTEKGLLLANLDGTAIEMKGKNVKVIAQESLQVLAKDAVLNSASVTLGENAMEPAVLGQTFANLWNVFIAHTHATAVGPSGPPVPPGLPLTPGAGLSLSVKVK